MAQKLHLYNSFVCLLCLFVCFKLFKVCAFFFRQCNSLVEKEYQCETCSKRFSTKTHLAFHRKIHVPDEEKPFKCSYCPRTFAYNHDCVHHMRLHVGEKPFKCSQCDAAFHRKSYLTEHMFVHTGVSKYRCQECMVSRSSWQRIFIIKANIFACKFFKSNSWTRKRD